MKEVHLVEGKSILGTEYKHGLHSSLPCALLKVEKCSTLVFAMKGRSLSFKTYDSQLNIQFGLSVTGQLKFIDLVHLLPMLFIFQTLHVLESFPCLYVYIFAIKAVLGFCWVFCHCVYQSTLGSDILIN